MPQLQHPLATSQRADFAELRDYRPDGGWGVVFEVLCPTPTNC